MTAALYNFPAPSTRFIGRTTELNQLVQQLARPAAVVTVVGTGGCGKTRLAVQAAARVESQFPDGVWFIDLAPLRDAALLSPAVAAALGVRDQPDQSIHATLLHALENKKLVLLLDNCEQVRTGCAEFVVSLCEACPTITVLATSRQALGLAIEAVFPLHPLAPADAIDLFAERAHAAAPYFHRDAENESAIADVCARLDYLPLAVELAAARVNMLAPAQIAARLDARLHFFRRTDPAAAERQTSLCALLDWSRELLDDAERTLFESLGVFPASFDLEAVEAVCPGATGENPTNGSPLTIDTLTTLAEKSLLVVEPGADRTRYQLLETIRAYAREKLDAAGSTTTLRSKHLEHFLRFAERAEPYLSTAAQPEWTARLDAEQENLQAALGYAVEAGHTGPGLRLANALWRYWNMRGHFYEGRNWYEALSLLPSENVPDAVRAKAFFCTGALRFRLGDLEGGMQLGVDSLKLQRELGLLQDMTVTLNMLGVIASERAEYAQALEWHAQALELRRAQGDVWGIAASLNNLGLVARAQGDFKRALDYYTASLATKRATGNRAEINIGLMNVAEVEILTGNYAHADALLHESVALSRTLGDNYNLGISLANHALARRALGDDVGARELSQQTIELARRSGDIADEAIGLANLGDLTRDEGHLADAAAQYEQAVSLLRPKQHARLLPIALNGLGVIRRLQGDLITAVNLHYEAFCAYQTAQNRLGLAEAIEGMAGIAGRWNEHARALSWLAATVAMRQQMGTPIYPFDRPLLDAIHDRAAESLGPGAAAEARLRGRTLDMTALSNELDAWHANVTHLVSPGAEQPALEIYAFGKSRVLRHGTVLNNKEWRYAKAREIVYYLLTRDAVSKETLALDLWPDSSPDQIRRALHRALHHARAALGQGDWILFEQERYSFQRKTSVRYDVERFARALAEASARKQSGERAGYLEALRYAVRSYDGDFLPDVEAEWAAAERALRREQFLDAAIALGDALLGDRCLDDAVAIYEKILAQDELNEPAQRGLMRCLARSGDAPGAMRRGTVFRERMRDELGADVSNETRLLYDQIGRGDPV